jgi:hypothetical protein
VFGKAKLSRANVAVQRMTAQELAAVQFHQARLDAVKEQIDEMGK